MDTTGYELSATGQNVLVYLNFHGPFVNLGRENTKFWNSSGVRIKGANDGDENQLRVPVHTQWREDIFSTPDKKEMGNRVSNGKHFRLHSDPEDDWLNWIPALGLGDESGNWQEKLHKKEKN